MQYQDLSLTPYANGYLECQAIKVSLKNKSTVSVMALYNQDKNISVDELRHYINQLGQSYPVIGDLNAHTPVLTNRTQKRNPTGRALEQILPRG